MSEPSETPRKSGPWVTIVQVVLLMVALVLSGYVAIQAFKPKPITPVTRFVGGSGFGARGPRGQGMRGMPQVDRTIVKDFDKNGDSRLNKTERAAAREWLLTQPRGGFGRFGRGVTATAEPGIHLAPKDVRAYPNASLYDT